MADRLSSRLPLIALALTLALVFHRLWLGEVFFWGLPALQFYPWREYAFDMIRQGQLPLWNPYNGAGAPLIANYQSALFYPPNWSGLMLPLAWSMSVTAVAHLFIAGWGMWAFTGRLCVPPVGRGISALAFGMTGYLVARLGTYPIISAAAWMPWLLWAALGVLTQGRHRDVGWLAAFAALQLLAGHAQTTWYSLLLIGIFTIWWLLAHRPSRRAATYMTPFPYHPVQSRRLGWLIVSLALAIGVAAIQLLPTAELLLLSQRSRGVDFDFAMNFSYSPARALNLLSPNVFGNPGDGSYATKGAFFEDAVYVGLIPLVSALAAVLSWLWGKARGLQRPVYFASVPLWLVVVLVAFVFALGKNSPVFPFLYNYVPMFDLFQAPVRWHIWTVFGLSVLAGIGVGAWGRGHWLFFGTRLAVAACIGAAVLAVLSPRFLPPDVATNDGVQVFIRAVTVTGVLGALAGLLTLRQPEQPDSRWYPWWSLAVLVVIAADLGYAALGLNPTVTPAFYDRLTPADYRPLRAYWPEDVEETVKFETYLPFDDYRVATDNWQEFRASGLANFNLLDRTYSLNNFDPLLVGHYAEYIDLIESNPQQRDSLLQAAGVSSVYNSDGEPLPLEQPAARVWFAESGCFYYTKAFLISSLLDTDWQSARQVYFPGLGDYCLSEPTTSASGEILTMADYGNSVVLEVAVERDSWLVLADTYYPGWTATIDGRPTEIFQTNLAFRSISVPPGAHVIRFDYHPWWLIPGALISIASLVIMLMLFRTKTPT